MTKKERKKMLNIHGEVILSNMDCRVCKKVTRVIEVAVPAQPAIEAHTELKEVTDYICGKAE